MNMVLTPTLQEWEGTYIYNVSLTHVDNAISNVHDNYHNSH